MDRKMYALPLGILLAGFGLYYFVFDSLNYTQHQSITIKETLQNNNDQPMHEHVDMHKEIEKIRENAEITFSSITLPQNTDSINTAPIEEKKKTKPTNNTKEIKEKIATANNESAVSYIPYKQTNTHKLPNMFESNLNAPTHIKLYPNTNSFHVATTQNTQGKNTKWVVPNTKDIKLYATPNKHAKIIAINKNGIKMQLIEQKNAWAHVRYAERRGHYIEGYVLLSLVRSAR